MHDELITEAEARELIGCARHRMREWVRDGSLWVINIATDLSGRPCYRVGRASALEMQKVCRKGAGSKQTRKLGGGYLQ